MASYLGQVDAHGTSESAQRKFYVPHKHTILFISLVVSTESTREVIRAVCFGDPSSVETASNDGAEPPRTRLPSSVP